MIKKYKKQLLYFGKWQISAIVTVPLMYFFADYLGMNYLFTTICFNFIGACLFYPIDAAIFKKK